jgi:hypothetical protein
MPLTELSYSRPGRVTSRLGTGKIVILFFTVDTYLVSPESPVDGAEEAVTQLLTQLQLGRENRYPFLTVYLVSPETPVDGAEEAVTQLLTQLQLGRENR